MIHKYQDIKSLLLLKPDMHELCWWSVESKTSYYSILLTFGRKRRQRVTVVEVRISDVTLTKESVTRSETRFAKDTANTDVRTTM